MARHVFIFLQCIGWLIGAQAQEEEYGLRTTALGRRIIGHADTTWCFYVHKADDKTKIFPDRSYSWYEKDTIMHTTGGYGEWVLDGKYTVTYPGGNLLEEGNFRQGLKDGEWKTWYPDGALRSIIHWKDGEKRGEEDLSADRPQPAARKEKMAKKPKEDGG